MGLVKIDIVDPTVTLTPKAMGKRRRHGQQTLIWVAT
jgi:hypothetical protein